MVPALKRWAIFEKLRRRAFPRLRAQFQTIEKLKQIPVVELNGVTLAHTRRNYLARYADAGKLLFNCTLHIHHHHQSKMKYPHANIGEVENEVRSFVRKTDELFGFYVDSIEGFRASMIRFANMEAYMKKNSPITDFDAKEFSFLFGNQARPRSPVIHKATIRELRARNAEKSSNHVRAGQHLIVMLYSFWEEEHRAMIKKALGIESNEPKREKCENCGQEIRKQKILPSEDLLLDVMGDVRLLRHDIIHNLGILQLAQFKKLKLLQNKRGMDLASGLVFKKLEPDKEIRFYLPDVYFLLTLVRGAMDKLVVEAGGKNPNYVTFKEMFV